MSLCLYVFIILSLCFCFFLFVCFVLFQFVCLLYFTLLVFRHLFSNERQKGCYGFRWKGRWRGTGNLKQRNLIYFPLKKKLETSQALGKQKKMFSYSFRGFLLHSWGRCSRGCILSHKSPQSGARCFSGNTYILLPFFMDHRLEGSTPSALNADGLSPRLSQITYFL